MMTQLLTKMNQYSVVFFLISLPGSKIKKMRRHQLFLDTWILLYMGDNTMIYVAKDLPAYMYVYE